MITLITDWLLGKYGTTSAAELPPEEAQKLLNDKYRLLTSLYDALEEQKRDINSQAVDLYEADMRAYTAAQTARARMLQSISEGRDKLTQEQIRQMGANARTLMETQARLLATYGARGRSKYDSVSRAVYGADPIRGDNDQPGYRMAVLLKLADLDPNDPATKLAIEAALESYGMAAGALPPATQRTYSRAVASYDKAVKAQEDMKALVDSADAGTLSAEEAQTRMASLPDFAPPSYTEKRTEVAATTDVSDLQAKIAGLEADIATDTSTQPKIGGLSQSEMSAILQNPNFRAWAESRGYKLGEMRDGGYVPRMGDYAALAAASRELAGGPVFRRGKEGGMETYQVVKPEAPGVETSLKYDAEGKVSDGWFVHPDGSIVRVDATTGKSTFVYQGGKWSSPKERAEWEAQSKESPPVPRSFNGAVLTDKDLMAMAGAEPVYADQFDIGAPAGLGSYVDVSGVAQPIRLGDDPNTTRRIRTETGDVVVLKRDEAGNWTMEDEASWGRIKKEPQPEYSRATRAETRRWEDRIAQLPGEEGRVAQPGENAKQPGANVAQRFVAALRSAASKAGVGKQGTPAGVSVPADTEDGSVRDARRPLSPPPAKSTPGRPRAAPVADWADKYRGKEYAEKETESMPGPADVLPIEEAYATEDARQAARAADALKKSARGPNGEVLGVTPETLRDMQGLAIMQADRALAQSRGQEPVSIPREEPVESKRQRMMQMGASPREALRSTGGESMSLPERMRLLRELRKQKKAQAEPEPALQE